MEIRTETQGQSTRLAMDGEMTIYHAADIKDELIKAVHEHKDLEIDLSKVSELDTAGFQLLVLAKRESQKIGHSLRLTEHSTPVLDVFNLYRSESFFGDPILISGTGQAA